MKHDPGTMNKYSIVANRYLSASIIFDRQLKARQKKWAFTQTEAFNAAAGLRNEVELRILERIKVDIFYYIMKT